MSILIVIIVAVIWFSIVMVLAWMEEEQKAKRKKQAKREKKKEGESYAAGYIPYSNRRSSIPTESKEPSQSRQIYENLFKGAKWGFD